MNPDNQNNEDVNGINESIINTQYTEPINSYKKIAILVLFALVIIMGVFFILSNLKSAKNSFVMGENNGVNKNTEDEMSGIKYTHPSGYVSFYHPVNWSINPDKGNLGQHVSFVSNNDSVNNSKRFEISIVKSDEIPQNSTEFSKLYWYFQVIKEENVLVGGIKSKKFTYSESGEYLGVMIFVPTGYNGWSGVVSYDFKDEKSIKEAESVLGSIKFDNSKFSSITQEQENYAVDVETNATFNLLKVISFNLKDSTKGYSGLCTTKDTSFVSIYNRFKNEIDPNIKCTGSKTDFAISLRYKGGKIQCIDSKNFLGEISNYHSGFVCN